MAVTARRAPVPWTSVLVALAGAGYCALQAGPARYGIPCSSSGCALFRDAALWGISLWWVGCGAFLFIALLCLRRLRSLALFFTGFGLLLDCVFLAIMAATAPCVSCLGAALFFGLLYYALRRAEPFGHTANTTSVLLLLWLVLFCAVGIAAANEHMGGWALYGATNAPERRVYFSPSCPACREAVAAFAATAAFYPVAERDADVAVIAAMQRALASGAGIQEALAFGRENPAQQIGARELLLLHVCLWRNKGEVLRQGFTKLPLLLVNGMPQPMTPQPDAQPQREGQPGSGALPPGLDLLGQCSDGPAPCAQ